MATKKAEGVVQDYTGMNVFQKLQMARVEFLKSGVKKSGKNMSLEFKYFELEDIIPTAEPLFGSIGLLMVPCFTENMAVAKVYNVDDSDEDPVVFQVPFTQISPIVSNSGKMVTNEMQALGSSITYMRRYLWQLVLDIVEADSIDSGSGSSGDSDTLPKTTKKKAPVTPEKRQEIKAQMTAAPAQAAPAEEITSLKGLLKQLMAVDPEQETFVQNVAMKTEGFNKITADQCSQLIAGIKQMLSGYENQEG